MVQMEVMLLAEMVEEHIQTLQQHQDIVLVMVEEEHLTMTMALQDHILEHLMDTVDMEIQVVLVAVEIQELLL